jgi:hypothetical protein
MKIERPVEWEIGHEALRTADQLSFLSQREESAKSITRQLAIQPCALL